MVADTSMRYARQLDRIEERAGPPADPVDLTELLGVWRAANHVTYGISRVELRERDGQVRAHTFAVDPVGGTTFDWGEVPVDGVYTDGPASGRVCGFRATFELGHARTQVQVNMLHSVAVCAAFTTFTDGSDRSNYFSREFLHRREEQR